MRVLAKSASMIQATIVTQSTAEPIALVSASVLRAAALQELNARAKTKSALTIQMMTVTQRMAVPIASVSVLAEPGPLLYSHFAPRRSLHPAADS